MAASSITIDQPKPLRYGNTIWGTLTGRFVDAATGGALYTDALAVVSPHFLPAPPPRIVVMGNTVANGYDFVAVGRAV